jgi:hypothetical protein
MDEKLVELSMKWLKAFEAVQAATKEKDVNAALVVPLGCRIANRRDAQLPRCGGRGSVVPGGEGI